MHQLRRLLWILCLTALLAGCDSTNQDSVITGTQPNPRPVDTVVRRWNRIAIDASGFDHSAAGAKEQKGPTRSSRAMAIVQIAVHDAIQAIQGRYETYLPQPRRNPDASIEAAVAQAAHDTLVALFPSQSATFDAALTDTLSAIADGPQKSDGLGAGEVAAALILADRAADGSTPDVQTGDYDYGQLPGEFRADPLSDMAPLDPQWGLVRPFALPLGTQFRCPPPPALESSEYAAAFQEVVRLGGDGNITPTERTREQTNIGIFWAYDGTPSLCAPPRLYNQIAAQIAGVVGSNDSGDLARLLALVNISLADAGICCWEAKYFYGVWRPVTGIREADPGTGPSGLGDGNPATTAISNFTPLGAPASNLAGPNFTPPFPAYPSGHATFGGSAFQILRRFVGTDNVPFTFVSDELNGVTVDNEGNTRDLIPFTFDSLSQAERQNAESRIYLGIHWRFDAEQGVSMGNSIADFVFDSVLRPLP
jgi:hypothetical protein